MAQEVERAESRIRPHIRETHLDWSPYLSKESRSNVWLKLENVQFTGSFKVRGALNKLLSLKEVQRKRGVVTASTGNHGAAVAFGLRKLRASGIVFVPENASPDKVEAIEQLGAQVRFWGTDPARTEAHARQYASTRSMPYISPYNDLQVVAGQGTIGLELAHQLETPDAVFVSLGGGGLISGIAGYLKTVCPAVEIIGCSPENSQVMIQSVRAGKILALPSRPTLSDGTAGGIEPGAMTFDLCRTLVDRYVTVTEDEIKKSLQLFIQTHHMLIEGAAAVALSGFLKQQQDFVARNVVIVLCGANISLETLQTVLFDPKKKRRVS
ncbi:MAG: threonine/serine dehydratase [bacterium]